MRHVTGVVSGEGTTGHKRVPCPATPGISSAIARAYARALTHLGQEEQEVRDDCRRHRGRVLLLDELHRWDGISIASRFNQSLQQVDAATVVSMDELCDRQRGTVRSICRVVNSGTTVG